jgi:quercetin dioxygenase-like cupin family protein
VGVTGAPQTRDFGAELEGYAYLPRMFDKARLTLAGDTGTLQFGCPLDHTCMARLGVYPETVLQLVSEHEDDLDILAGLRAHGIAAAADAWFDARATEDELLEGIYLKVRPRGRIDELKPREGHVVVAVEEGAAKVCLGERQMRIVRAGEVVRIPPEMPHRIESASGAPLRTTRLDGV